MAESKITVEVITRSGIATFEGTSDGSSGGIYIMSVIPYPRTDDIFKISSGNPLEAIEPWR